MRIAFAGVAHSHPFTDAETAALHGVTEFVVWDVDDVGRRRAFVERCCAEEVGSLEALLASGPDLAVVTTRPSRTVPTVAAVLDRGIPCLLNKVAASSAAGLHALDEVVRQRGESGFFTSSVLRFAPAVQEFVHEVQGDDILALDVLVRHSITPFLDPLRRWQDDPAGGGGTAVSLGLHGWELAEMLCPGITVAAAVRARSAASTTLSENVLMCRASGGLGELVGIQVIGAEGGDELYRLSINTAHTYRSVTIEPGDDPLRSLGFLECMAAALRMADGAPPPVPWHESRRVLATSIEAATLARQSADDANWIA